MLRQCASWPAPIESIRWPLISISPPVGVSSPPIRLSRVDLPEPDGPISATKSPSGISRSMPCRTWTSSGPRW